MKNSLAIFFQFRCSVYCVWCQTVFAMRWLMYATKMARRIMASQRSILSRDAENIHSSTTEPRRTAMSMGVMPVMVMGHTSPVMLRMKSMLKTLEPRTLPMAMPLLPLRAATRVVASSGREVPPATTVSPMTASLTWSRWATLTA